MANPFDDARRAQSEEAAFRAERAWGEGKADEARRLFAEAADLEEQVAREVPATAARVRSVLAISAVALWYKAGDFERAKRLAYVFLADEGRRKVAPISKSLSTDARARARCRSSRTIPAWSPSR